MGNTAKFQTARDIYHGMWDLALERLTETLEISRESFRVSDLEASALRVMMGPDNSICHYNTVVLGPVKILAQIIQSLQVSQPANTTCDLLRGRAYQHE
ncbi:uncharacterized protein N7469_010543 [Penicillium citrinum]|uniref:Uncharacterized protein n=2 Tax=Penicillium TaxID=5073 RepID=A0A9W9NKH3_PENCI|nr:uncharacterized protein N7469_010543 [Penicillium citrinum]KAJ5221656.1 hypothetical protein N7469_010543 [Penicillium citrinum]KAJ5596623.1 hypothetical protein N7450_003081 [Penicillium hetheringtonii]KAK5797815.1 hypothetical protein VI817_004106 [Penicillium citrinum]